MGLLMVQAQGEVRHDAASWSIRDALFHVGLEFKAAPLVVVRTNECNSSWRGRVCYFSFGQCKCVFKSRHCIVECFQKTVVFRLDSSDL